METSDSDGDQSKTNSDTFRGAAPGTLRVRISATEETQDDVDFWKVSYVFTYNPNGWQPKVLEAGLYQLIDNRAGTAKRKVPCTEMGGDPLESQEATHPMPLDADGKQIPHEDALTDAIYTTWNIYQELPYGNLGL